MGFVFQAFWLWLVLMVFFYSLNWCVQMMFVQWKIVGKERVRLLMLQCLVLTASVILVGRRYRLVLWPSPIVVFPTVSASLPVSLRACMCWLECEVLMIFFVSVLKLITIMSMPASRIYVFCTQQNRYIYIYIYISSTGSLLLVLGFGSDILPFDRRVF